jgi:hypothetical protein
MSNRLIAALAERLRPHVDLSKSRLDTLCLLIVGTLGARTVNLGHVATERGGTALVASTYRRLQRFFQFVTLGEDWSVPLLAAMIGGGPWTLALDRTAWKIGRKEVNFLVLAAVTRRFRVPLFWTLLPGAGNSSTKVRIALVRRYLAHFPATSVRVLLADREFIGAAWQKFLCDNNVPFAIRLRENMRVTDELGHDLTLGARLHRAGRGRSFRARVGSRKDLEKTGAPMLTIAVKRLAGEWLIVATNLSARTGLDAYRRRWRIECLFAQAKTRGLNLEDTRLTCPRKLVLLMAIVALALAWAARAAADPLGPKQPPRKAHGYPAQSHFRVGFDWLRNCLRSDPLKAISPWRVLPKHPKKPRVV